MSASAPLPTTVLPTTLSEKVLSKVWLVGAAMGTTFLARGLVSVAWRVVMGTRPPKADDPEVPKAQSRAWALATAAGLAVTRLLVKRTGLGTPGH